jgi:hypothetical protein
MVVVLVARGAATAAAVMERVVDECVVVSQCELTFPALCLVAPGLGTVERERPTRREIANVASRSQCCAMLMREKKVTRLPVYVGTSLRCCLIALALHWLSGE